jgi:hypothetical protein
LLGTSDDVWIKPKDLVGTHSTTCGAADTAIAGCYSCDATGYATNMAHKADGIPFWGQCGAGCGQLKRNGGSELTAKDKKTATPIGGDGTTDGTETKYPFCYGPGHGAGASMCATKAEDCVTGATFYTIYETSYQPTCTCDKVRVGVCKPTSGSTYAGVDSSWCETGDTWYGPNSAEDDKAYYLCAGTGNADRTVNSATITAEVVPSFGACYSQIGSQGNAAGHSTHSMFCALSSSYCGENVYDLGSGISPSPTYAPTPAPTSDWIAENGPWFYAVIGAVVVIGAVAVLAYRAGKLQGLMSWKMFSSKFVDDEPKAATELAPATARATTPGTSKGSGTKTSARV